ncbi:MAG: hypothetical protein JNN27_00515 [Planctomycetes bacterium]|nr:hypothetical protein [Planctomycetota bacterium]
MDVQSTTAMTAEDALQDACARMKQDAKENSEARTLRQHAIRQRKRLVDALDAAGAYKGRGDDERFIRGWLPILRTVADAWSEGAPPELLERAMTTGAPADRPMLAVIRLALRRASDEKLTGALRTVLDALTESGHPTNMHRVFDTLRDLVVDSALQSGELVTVAATTPVTSPAPPVSAVEKSPERRVRVTRVQRGKKHGLRFELQAANEPLPCASIDGPVQSEVFLALATKPGRAEATWQDLANALRRKGLSTASADSLRRMGRHLKQKLPPWLAERWNQSESGVRLDVEWEPRLADGEGCVLRLNG